MRCPKCNFISFDDQASCMKCAHDLTEAAEQLHGTSIKVQTPDFLASLLKKATEPGEKDAEMPSGISEMEEAELESEEEGLDLDISEESAESEEAEEAESEELKELEVSDLVPSEEEDVAPVEEPAEEDTESGIQFESGEGEDEGGIVDLSSLMDEPDAGTSEQEEAGDSDDDDFTVEEEATDSGLELDLDVSAEEDEAGDLIMESENNKEGVQIDEAGSDIEDELKLTLEDDETSLDIPDSGLSLEDGDDE